MDFAIDEDLFELQSLASRITGDFAAPDRLRGLEEQGRTLDEELWSTLAQAGLLAAPLPVEHGGSGLGLAGLSVMLAGPTIIAQGTGAARGPDAVVVDGCGGAGAHQVGGCGARRPARRGRLRHRARRARSRGARQSRGRAATLPCGGRR